MRKIGIDISAYQGRPDPSWFDSLPDLGIEVGWVQLYGGGPDRIGPNPHAEYQLSQFRHAGCDTGGYIWFPPGSHIPTVMQEAKAAAGVEFQHLLFGTLDIEGRYHGEARLLDAYVQLQSLMHPRPVTLYTSKSQWLAQGNPTILGDVPLHEAWYFSTQPSLTHVRESFDSLTRSALPFGGWTQRAAWQFIGSSANGVGADWNVFDYDRMGIITEGGDDVDPQLEAALKKFFVEPHGIAGYNAKWPERVNMTRAEVVALADAYSDAYYFKTILEGLDAIKLTLTDLRPLSNYSVDELLAELRERFSKIVS